MDILKDCCGLTPSGSYFSVIVRIFKVLKNPRRKPPYFFGLILSLDYNMVEKYTIALSIYHLISAIS